MEKWLLNAEYPEKHPDMNFCAAAHVTSLPVQGLQSAWRVVLMHMPIFRINVQQLRQRDGAAGETQYMRRIDTEPKRVTPSRFPLGRTEAGCEHTSAGQTRRERAERALAEGPTVRCPRPVGGQKEIEPELETVRINEIHRELGVRMDTMTRQMFGA
eukprot:364416-Chlamydomonas_euryale.AAC.7